MTPRSALTMLGAVLCLSSLVGCTDESGPDEPDAQVRAHGVGDGPLSLAGWIEGGQSIFAPPAREWTATIGSFFPCSVDARADLRIEGVRALDEGGITGFDSLMRTVDDSEVTPTAQADGSASPLVSALGGAPDFDQRYAGLRPGDLVGSYEHPTSAQIPTCDEAVPADGGFEELLVVMSTDSRGGQVAGLTIDYTADGEPRRLTAPYPVVLCGSRAREGCAGRG